MRSDAVTVFGAYGHTGRFVVSELRKREWTPILSGRDPAKLAALGAVHPHAEIRPASADDPASLDAAIAGAAAVINCAGPFATTAAPVIEAALRARIPTWTSQQRSRRTPTPSSISPVGRATPES